MLEIKWLISNDFNCFCFWFSDFCWFLSISIDICWFSDEWCWFPLMFVFVCIDLLLMVCVVLNADVFCWFQLIFCWVLTTSVDFHWFFFEIRWFLLISVEFWWILLISNDWSQMIDFEWLQLIVLWLSFDFHWFVLISIDFYWFLSMSVDEWCWFLLVYLWFSIDLLLIVCFAFIAAVFRLISLDFPIDFSWLLLIFIDFAEFRWFLWISDQFPLVVFRNQSFEQKNKSKWSEINRNYSSSAKRQWISTEVIWNQ